MENNTELNDLIEKYKELHEKDENKQVCPNCGHCPHCGQSRRYVPYTWPNTPYYGQFYTTC